MDLELHQLDRRYEVLRRRQPERERGLMASLAEHGQQVPIVVVALSSPRRYLVIDGFKRLRCLERLGSDTVQATQWDLSESEALLLDSSQRSSEAPCQLEQGWLLSVLREQGMNLEELARRFARSPSWVSRHLGLVCDLPASVQEQVRQGAIPAHAAMRYLLPLGRRHREDCQRLAAAIAAAHLTSREVGALCDAWLRSSPPVRERLEKDPRLYLRARAQRQEPAPLPVAQELLRDIDRMAQTARRLSLRVQQSELSPSELCELHQALRQTRTELEELDKEIDRAEQDRAHRHPEAVREGRFETPDRQASQDLEKQCEQGDQVPEQETAEDRAGVPGRALPRSDPGAFLDVSGQPRARPRGASGSEGADLLLHPDRLLPSTRNRDPAQDAGRQVSLRAGPGDSA